MYDNSNLRYLGTLATRFLTRPAVAGWRAPSVVATTHLVCAGHEYLPPFFESSREERATTTMSAQFIQRIVNYVANVRILW